MSLESKVVPSERQQSLPGVGVSQQYGEKGSGAPSFEEPSLQFVPFTDQQILNSGANPHSGEAKIRNSQNQPASLPKTPQVIGHANSVNAYSLFSLLSPDPLLSLETADAMSISEGSEHSNAFSTEEFTTPEHDFSLPETSSKDKDRRIMQLEGRIGELENLVSKLTGIASFSQANSFGAGADDWYQGPIHDVWNMASSELNWSLVLLRALPSKEHCKVYADYYFEFVDYVYHPLHNATFRQELDEFWLKKPNEIDVIWLSILFMVISLSALHLPNDIAKKLNGKDSVFNHSESSAQWFRASRQALQAGRYDEKPRFEQLQTFSLTQSYLYATNQIELLNSLLSQAVRHCHALGLHSDTRGADCLDTELRRRIWWDVCGCDTLQSLCMGRPVLINSYSSVVPFPCNCNEEDMSADDIKHRPRDEPTIMSFHIERNLIMKILNQLYTRVDGRQASYDKVMAADQELRDYVHTMPWFFKLGPDGAFANGLGDKIPKRLDCINFQANMLHTYLCMHRVRIHQPFLQQKSLPSSEICLVSVKNMFTVYNQLRQKFGSVTSHPNFISQAHQAFSGAVAQSMFLLVENTTKADTELLTRDIDMFVDDLVTLVNTHSLRIPILTDGIKTIARIKEIITNPDTAAEKSFNVISGVYSVFGGKAVTEKYLRRCKIDFLVNSSDVVTKPKKLTKCGNIAPASPEPETVVPSRGPHGLGYLAINGITEAPTGRTMWDFPPQSATHKSFQLEEFENDLAGKKKIDLTRWDNSQMNTEIINS